MSNRIRFALLLLASSHALLTAGEFRTGQAARAVIGQPSFSAAEPGIVARALNVSKGTLYVADNSNRVLAFDTAHLVNTKSAGCVVCVTSPVSVANQGVLAGVASSASYGRTVVVADTKGHRVMIWRGATVKPDVVLPLAEPVSVALDGQHLFVGDAGTHRVFVWKSLPAADDQPADAVLGHADNEVGETTADTIEDPVALASDGANLFVADAAAGRVLVFTPGDTPLSSRQILNAASLSPGLLAPGSLISIEYPAVSTPHVLLDGVELPVLESSADAVETQLPYLLNSDSSSLVIRADRGDGTTSYSDAVAVSFVDASPGIYAFGGKEPRSGLLLREGEPLTSDSPARAGDVITIWAAGMGAVDAASENRSVQTPVRAYINGQPVVVLSAQLPKEAVGVYEVRVQLPPSLPQGKTATLLLAQNDVKSNAVTFPLAPSN